MEKYYIQNRERGFIGNAVVFWKKDDRGYTSDLNDAKQFTEDEAIKTCQGNPDKFIAWPVEYVDKSDGVQRIVDHQYLALVHGTNFSQSPPSKSNG